MGKVIKTIPAAETSPFRVATRWAATTADFIAGQAIIDGVDALGAEMECKWGCDRLRLLVGSDLRRRFDRQRYLYNQAVWHATNVSDVEYQAVRMDNAYRVLDEEATRSGAEPLHPQVWEIALEDGTVAAVVPDVHHTKHVRADGRELAVYTLNEIGRLLSAFPGISQVKGFFPGAAISVVRREIDDPLNDVVDTVEAI